MYLVDLVLMLVQPSLYLLFAALSLAQFQILYSYVLHYLAVAAKHQSLKLFSVYFSSVTVNLEKVLGSPQNMRFDLTHVLLAAILLASLVSMEKLRIIIERQVKYRS
jgi:hypothetical protein